MKRCFFFVLLCLLASKSYAEYNLRFSFVHKDGDSFSIRYADSFVRTWISIALQHDKVELQGFLLDTARLQFGSFAENGVYTRLARHSKLHAWSQTFTQKRTWQRNYNPSTTVGTRVVLGKISMWQRYSERVHTVGIDTWFWNTEYISVYSALLYHTQRNYKAYDSWIIPEGPRRYAAMHYTVMGAISVRSFRLAIDATLSKSIHEAARPSLRLHFLVPFATNKISFLYSYHNEGYRDREARLPEWNHELSAEMKNIFPRSSIISRFAFRYRHLEPLPRWSIDASFRYRLEQRMQKLSLREEILLQAYADSSHKNTKAKIDVLFHLAHSDARVALAGQLTWLPGEKQALQEKIQLKLEWRRPITLGLTFSVTFHEEITLGSTVSIGAKLRDIETKLQLTIFDERPVKALHGFAEDIVLTWSIHYTLRK